MDKLLLKSVLRNFGYLVFVRYLNLVFPLFLYPYIFRTVGPESFGAYIAAVSAYGIFALFVNYGFGLYGTRAIARSRNDINDVNGIASRVLSMQLLILVCTIVPAGYLAIYLTDNLIVSILASHVLLYEVLVPVWLFQGLERMNIAALISVVSKLITSALVIVLVHSSEDVVLVALSYAVGTVLSGLTGWYFICRLESLRIRLELTRETLREYRRAFPCFLSYGMGGVIPKASLFLVGSSSSGAQLAYYDFAEKVISIFNGLFQSVSFALFPVISRTADAYLVRIFIRAVLAASLVSVCVVFTLSESIIIYGTGIESSEAVVILRIVAVGLVFRAIGPILGNSVLLANDLESVLVRSFLAGTVAYVVSIGCIMLVSGLSPVTIAASVTLAMGATVLYRIILIFSNGLRSWIF